MKTNPEKLCSVLVTDCGSTTTKAVLFEKTAEGWRQTFRGEAPTTVENPIADVTVGALNAFSEVEELSRRKILNPKPGPHPFIETKEKRSEGIDLYLSTSSAGGGLQMIVAGVVREMTAESAQRAALGAGAIVLETISADDGREDFERIERIRHLRPDIVLITGGVDGGTKQHVVEMAELLLAAAPRPRFGDTLKLPVIYAGNKEAADEVTRILGKMAHVEVVSNVRPTLEEENLTPARDAIHEFFLKHVMSHAPGYGKLLAWTPVPVMPTPGAVGDMVLGFATSKKLQVLAVDIGGATTDVFSVFNNPFNNEPTFNRTVSANLGMSYSVANVLIEAGTANIARWLPFEMDHGEIHDRLRNKMIRPTSIPQTLEDLLLEQAVCREALRLSLVHHRSLAVGLSGVKRQRGIADIFAQKSNRTELVDMLKLDVVIGSGGVLSHAPDRRSAMLMMLDAFELSGITQVAVDSIFMMPHLGVLASVHKAAAEEILLKDCLINLGIAVAPIFSPKSKSKDLADLYVSGRKVETIRRGEVRLLRIDRGCKVTLKVEPLDGSVELGLGPGRAIEREIETGEVGIVLDGRNRPIEFLEDPALRIGKQREIYNSMGLQIK